MDLIKALEGETCWNCGKKLVDMPSDVDFKNFPIAVVWFDEGHPGDKYEPPESPSVYIECWSCYSRKVTSGCPTCKKVAFITGATDGDVLKAVRRVLRLLRVYQWAVDNMSILIDGSHNEQLIRKKEEIRSEIGKEINKDVESKRAVVVPYSGVLVSEVADLIVRFGGYFDTDKGAVVFPEDGDLIEELESREIDFELTEAKS